MTATSQHKPMRSSINNVRPHAWVVRFFFRLISRLFTAVFTRTTVSGLENIPKNGPAIFVANHFSIYDAILYFAFLPPQTQYVGPGDFRLKYPNRAAAEWTDVILVKRGTSDTSSLRAMIDTLKSGGYLGLFPEGGTWEKRLYDVKDGAAYLSMVGQAPLVPIAISGTYDLWSEIWQLKRPKLVMEILPPMPPVPKASRNERREVLAHATYELMHTIYQHLTESELERYKVFMRQRFTGCFEVRGGDGTLFANAQNYKVLAELVTKKNLFSTFHEHLKLPLSPFMNLRRYHSLVSMRAAVDSLHDAIIHDVPGYIEYRLGDEAAQHILAELEEIQGVLRSVHDKSLRLRFVVDIEEDKDKEITLAPPAIEEAIVGAM